MVSHDRYLIEACADQLWIVADHAVTNYDGDLDDYRRMVLSARGMRTNSRDRGGNERGNGKPQRNKSEKRVPLKQKISDAEAEISRINGIIAKIDTALALPDLFKRDPKQAASSARRAPARVSALQRAEEQWLAPVRNMTKRPAKPVQVQQSKLRGFEVAKVYGAAIRSPPAAFSSPWAWRPSAAPPSEVRARSMTGVRP